MLIRRPTRTLRSPKSSVEPRAEPPRCGPGSRRRQPRNPHPRGLAPRRHPRACSQGRRFETAEPRPLGVSMAIDAGNAEAQPRATSALAPTAIGLDRRSKIRGSMVAPGELLKWMFAPMPDSGLLTPQSAIGFATLEILAERHVGIFAEVDHAEGAAAAGLARDQPRSRYSAFPCNSRSCAASISGVPPPADEGAGLARCGWNRQFFVQCSRMDCGPTRHERHNRSGPRIVDRCD